MRLFAAIELDEPVRAAAAALVAALQRRAGELAPRARLTWVPADRMHLTVRFIGEVDAARGERVLGALREPLDTAPFSLWLEGLGSFPTRGEPRVLWVGVGEGTTAAQQVEATIATRLRAIGIPGEGRAYSPHLTLARVRDAAGLRPRALFEGLSPRLGGVRVEAITLFESRLSPRGPAYVVLARTALRGS